MTSPPRVVRNSKPEGFVVATTMLPSSAVLQSLRSAGLVRRIVETRAELEGLRSANVLLLSWRHILSKEFIARQTAVLNVHNSLLPKYRGRHAFTWALINGEPIVGFSLHSVDAGVDTGPIYAQVPMVVGAKDDINTLFARGWVLLAEWLPRQLRLLEEGRLRAFPQEEAAATTFRARSPEDGEIGWAASRAAIINLVRALRPPYTPGAFFVYRGVKHHIDQAIPVERTSQSAVAGRVTEVSKEDGRLLIECGDGALWVQVVGKQLGDDAPLAGASVSTPNH